MKVPQNYNAGATKKANPLEEAINSNFTNQQTAKNTLPDARESILTGEKTVTSHISQAEPVREEAAQAIPEAEPKTPTRREVKEKFLVSMSKGERSIFKSFCALKGVSMNHFVMCAMDYFKEDLENGKVSISSHSYKRKEV